MANSDDLKFLPVLDYVIKQLRTKGRVKIPHG